MTTIRQAIKRLTSLDQDELVHLAYLDAIDALLRLAICGRTTAEATRVLESWRCVFEKAERSRKAMHQVRRT